MTDPTGKLGAAAQWVDALFVAALIAVDRAGIGGARVRSRAGPVRDAWLAALRDLLPLDVPVRRAPANIADDRLLGGLDLSATLRAGRPIAETGLLAAADGGIIVIPMAERLSGAVAARFAAALDSGTIAIERDGVALRSAACFAAIAFDEGEDDEHPPAALLDRLAFEVDLHAIGMSALRQQLESVVGLSRDTIDAARAKFPNVAASAAVVEALAAAAIALGVDSMRTTLFAVRAARAIAALDRRDHVSTDDAALAARLVLAPRATRVPAKASAEERDQPDSAPPEERDNNLDRDPPGDDRRDDPPPLDNQDVSINQDDSNIRDDSNNSDDSQPSTEPTPVDDRVIQAAVAAIPAGLLARLLLAQAPGKATAAMGKAGSLQASTARGRPTGTMAGDPRSGARLSLIDTLRAAAPWQPMRRREQRIGATAAPRIHVRREDIRVRRYQAHTSTTTIFVVDASGSAALNRLAEAKGAVELLLADCYVRRDQVALIAFRGRTAELLLPPTRSLARAKRALSELPGGGATPLATGIDAAIATADGVTRRGSTPIVVLLTDGRANVARDASTDRGRAETDALSAARRVRAAGVTALLVDTAPRAGAFSQRLAKDMAAQYIALPYADARTLSQAVTVASQVGSPR